VIKLTRKIVKDGSAAEDVAQEVWLKVWARRAEQNGGSFMAWVGMIAKTTAIDSLRAGTRQKETADGLRAELDDDRACHPPDRCLEAKEAVETLAGALKALPDGFQETLELQAAGLTRKQISKRLGIPRDTVKGRLYVARKLLRRRLQEEV